jgi:Tol biopolymer transport system component
MSYATNIVEGSNTLSHRQVYLRDLRRGITTLVSRDASDPLVGADTGGCSDPTISPNGRFLAFLSNATNLLPASSNGAYQVFVKDLRTGVLRVASTDADGNLADGNSHSPVVSNDGRWVAFWTGASNLAAGDTPAKSDTVLKDMRTGEVRILSSSADANDSFEAALSANGRTVVFYSEKTDLVPADGNGTADVYAFDPGAGTLRRLTVNGAGAEGNGYSYSFSTALSSNGKWVVVSSDADNLVEGIPDAGGHTDLFLLRAK